MFVSHEEITKAVLEKGPSGLTAPRGAPVTASPTSLDKRLATSLAEVKEACDTSSKVVDENGKP